MNFILCSPVLIILPFTPSNFGPITTTMAIISTIARVHAIILFERTCSYTGQHTHTHENAL